MPVRICGIDVGSHSVKICFYESGFRRSRLLGYYAAEVAGSAQPAGSGRPAEAREPQAAEPGTSTIPLGPEQVDALRRLTGGQRIRADSVVVAAPGDVASVRYLSFPFSDARKISPVVGYELEGQIPLSLQEVTYDHLILPMKRGPAAGGHATRVIVAAAAQSHIRQLIDGLAAAGVDPSVVTVAPLAYGFLSDAAGPAAGEAILVLDIGHRRTNFCILSGGRPVFVRTLSRGGYHVTAELARALSVDPHTAEQTKRKQAFAPVEGQVAYAAHERLGDAVRTALKPWDMGLRQSLSAARSDLGVEIGTVLLCGGGSLLRGMERHVADVAGLPPAAVTHVHEHITAGHGPEAVAALGLCHLAADRRRDALNLRRGELAPVSGTSLLRERALTFAAALTVALGLVTLNGWVKLHLLRKEQGLLAKELGVQTGNVLGKPMTNPDKVLPIITKLRRKKGGVLPIPKASAFAVLSEISRRTPPKNNMTLDVKKLEINKGKILLKGTAASASEVEQLSKALENIKCFEKVEPGRTTEVGSGEEKKSEFTVTITSDCM